MNHSPRGEDRCADGRSVISAGAGAAAWHLHPELAPWPPSGTVPILDLIELRTALQVQARFKAVDPPVDRQTE